MAAVLGDVQSRECRVKGYSIRLVQGRRGTDCVRSASSAVARNRGDGRCRYCYPANAIIEPIGDIQPAAGMPSG